MFRLLFTSCSVYEREKRDDEPFQTSEHLQTVRTSALTSLPKDKMLTSPGVHPAINYRVIHRVTHRQPVDSEVNLLNVFGCGDLWVVGC